jgi:putative phosphonate transport system ATP-binding protein
MNMQVNPQELGLDPAPLLSVANVSRFYGERIGCADVSFDLWPGEGCWGSSANPARASRRCCAALPASTSPMKGEGAVPRRG